LRIRRCPRGTPRAKVLADEWRRTNHDPLRPRRKYAGPTINAIMMHVPQIALILTEWHGYEPDRARRVAWQLKDAGLELSRRQGRL
jgi:hypothetical protein